MKLYSTIAGPGSGEYIVEKSRFLPHAMPVRTREDADRFIREIRKEYRDATHNVPAMVIGPKMEIQWASDDGEPQGTSGAPIVQMLTEEGLTDLVIVVTRYFGGIKLGTGGLVRAYTKAAKLALEDAGICDIEEKRELRFRIGYPEYSRVSAFDFGGRAEILEPEFTDRVTVSAVSEPEDRDWLLETLAGITNGKAELIEEKDRLITVPAGSEK